MNKSIIVVNTPDCCYHCKFNIIDGDVHDCYICHKKFESDNQMIRQSWCPMKDINSNTMVLFTAKCEPMMMEMPTMEEYLGEQE